MSRVISVSTKNAGILNCEIVGDPERTSTVILTVHDLGCNSSSWQNFVNHPCMEEVKKRATWVHVNLPGQEVNAPDLPEGYVYPSLDNLAAALDEVIKSSNFHSPVVAIGEGAGANIVARYTLLAPDELLGSILIHCTSTTAGYMESMKDKEINWKLMGGMHPTAEQYLTLHRFGDLSSVADDGGAAKAVADFLDSLETKINPKNLSMYINTFMSRTNIAERMNELKLPLLLITGQRANHNHTVHTFYNATLKLVPDRKLVEFVVIPNVANVIEGAPTQFASAALFFMQGLGVLASVPMPGSQRRSSVPGVTMMNLDKSDL